ncbi:uncharacterized protein EV420DRAFT_1641537 [Desarmillaria tabescens]|uniref:Uncharacterized protein n=1 Tax=Armillaria tabescens TaxID=1929756 RepID=A0AA39KFM0_ARMTA|nr:uncharacterized protein EV420DRAFT_1641537 [Desarmillaria tabescens]KAK0460210.1 hypothetical protein EV420DRAFT_1641537 [Desarmillaria tabescens]
MSNDPYKTNEPAESLWIEQTYNATTYIGAIAYGAQLVIAYLAIYHILYGKRQKFAWQYITYIALLVVLSTAYTIGNINACELTWIDERNYPGGPPQSIIITFLADICLLWRCYVVYHNKWIVVVLPALILFSTATMGILYLIEIASPRNSSSGITIKAHVAYRSLSVTFNILVTLMMVARLLLIRKKIRASLGPQYGRLYTGLAALMIESALPHTIVSVLLIGLYCSNHIAYLLFVPLLTMIEAATPQLIILRVASGYALSRETVATADRQLPVQRDCRGSNALDTALVPGVRQSTLPETTLVGVSSGEVKKAS